MSAGEPATPTKAQSPTVLHHNQSFLAIAGSTNPVIRKYNWVLVDSKDATFRSTDGECSLCGFEPVDARRSVRVPLEGASVVFSNEFVRGVYFEWASVDNTAIKATVKVHGRDGSVQSFEHKGHSFGLIYQLGFFIKKITFHDMPSQSHIGGLTTVHPLPPSTAGKEACMIFGDRGQFDGAAKAKCTSVSFNDVAGKMDTVMSVATPVSDIVFKEPNTLVHSQYGIYFAVGQTDVLDVKLPPGTRGLVLRQKIVVTFSNKSPLLFVSAVCDNGQVLNEMTSNEVVGILCRGLRTLQSVKFRSSIFSIWLSDWEILKGPVTATATAETSPPAKSDSLLRLTGMFDSINLSAPAAMTTVSTTSSLSATAPDPKSSAAAKAVPASDAKTYESNPIPIQTQPPDHMQL